MQHDRGWVLGTATTLQDQEEENMGATMNSLRRSA